MGNEFRIRLARAEDAPVLCELIRELAAYERLEGEAVATPELLQKWMFDKGHAEALLAEDNHGAALGFALYFHNFSTFLGRAGLYLEDLFVRPEARGKGLGRALFQRVARTAIELGCGRLDWWCLDWNESAQEFYRRSGAQPMADWTVWRLQGDTLARAAGTP